ncbi:hypothetical protein [Flavobacterium sp. 25HG05S-40]|uniref:hypothetical protein n=1 Tax=Flavobacterium sp. 25HG05S-40 TaxID=3458682 RepID=UPI004044FB60
MRHTFLILKLLVVTSVSTNSFSQIAISNTSEIEKIKTGTTFFAMKDPDSPKAAAYVEAIKKSWTLSKVSFIKYSDVEKNIAPNNSFVTIGAKMTSSNSSSVTETNFYLEFWTTNGKFVYDPKKRKHFNQDDKIIIATVALFPDFTTQNNPSSLYKMDYDASGHLKNWSSAIVGNYIQQVVMLLEKGTALTSKTTFFNKEEVHQLSSQTLYIPDYVLTKFAKNSADDSKKISEKELMENSTLSCKFLSTTELNEKIISATAPLYYLLLIKTNTDKWITVTNSQTGEIVYSAYSNSSGNFKPSDLKELQKAIQKN